MSETVCLIGIGGAGGRIIARAGAGVPESVHLAAVNTDTAELAELELPVKLQIGAKRTRGAGCGGNAGTGRLAAEDDLSTVRELFAGARLVLAAAGLGGGTGTGALPAVLRAAHEAGALSAALVTLPFAFEGPTRRAAAEEALRGVRDAADLLVAVSNDRLLETIEDDRVAAAFERADAIVGDSAATLCNLVARPAYIRLDFGDLQDLIGRCDGVCTLGYAEGEGRNRAQKAADALLKGPMLEAGKLLAGAGAILVGIVGGEDLALKDVGDLMQAIQDHAPEGCRIGMGTTLNPALKRKLTAVVFTGDAAIAVPAAESRAEAGARKPARRTRRVKANERQRLLELDLTPTGRGRFKNVEPTVLDGEDLDIPTYIRRGISLDKIQ